ncbi:MobC [Erwinia amylovora]|uniref:MobC n=1 Tax=Erwinia amylovora TaxID=552 RepID=UPI0014441EFB|nr:MobC [Erwinia amylovora]
MMAPSKAKQYCQTDIESMRSKLSDLPDVTQERLQKKDVLDSLRDDINALMTSKGYTINEVHDHLKNFGFVDVTLRDLKEITAGKKKRQDKRGALKSAGESKTGAENQ